MVTKRRRGAGSHDNFMAKNLDELEAYEEFTKEILPKLRQAIKKGKSAEDIYKMAQAAAAARAVTIAVTEADPTKAMTAIKDILDRSGGKATERTEVTHKYENLKEEQLDSLLLSELGTLDDTSTDEAH